MEFGSSSNFGQIKTHMAMRNYPCVLEAKARLHSACTTEPPNQFLDTIQIGARIPTQLPENLVPFANFLTQLLHYRTFDDEIENMVGQLTT